MTFSLMTPSLIDIQHNVLNDTFLFMLGVFIQIVVILGHAVLSVVTECHYADCCIV
jgi:hypothetical protein